MFESSRLSLKFAAPLFALCCALPASAAPLVDLGTSSGFAVLGGTTVTNTGPTIITGDVGVSPGSAITGFPPGIVMPPYILHVNDASAVQAHMDLLTAYNNGQGLTGATNLSGQDLGGLTLTPGLYSFASSAQLTGTLTLDYLGDSNNQFGFQIGSTLTAATGSQVLAINTGWGGIAQAGGGLFWFVGSSATVGTNSAFEGNILALTSITFDNGASDASGRALAYNGAVTLDSNAITLPNNAGPAGAPELDAKATTLPLAFLSLVLLLVGDGRRRQQV